MIKPIQDKVYIAPISDADTSAGGIVIPDQAKERIDQGIVKYVGPDVQDIKPGDYVIFPNYSGTLIYIEDEEDLLIIMREDDITATLVEPINISIPGLYTKTLERVEDSKGMRVVIDRYFPVDYTTAIRYITDAIKNAEWHKNMRVIPSDNMREKLKDERGLAKSPTTDDYIEDVLRRNHIRPDNKSFGGI